MRNWPQKTQRRARIEIIPMIDVMMFLLVFFVLISINVLPALGLKIVPPGSASPDKIVEKIRITVGIDADGKTYIDGQPVEKTNMALRLKEITGEKQAAVIISGDQGSPLQDLVGVMDALRAAGITSTHIVTRQK